MASHKHRTQRWASEQKSHQGFAPDGLRQPPGAGLLNANGTAAAPPAGSPAGTPPAAAASPHVDPFLTPDDLLAINAFNSNDAQSRADLTRGLADLTTNTNFQLGQLQTQAVKATSDTQDNAAARGIFQSSIKDGNIYDIEAQRRINSGLLNDRLTTAQTDAATRLAGLDTSKTNFDTAMLGKQVQNAQAITPTVPSTTPPAASPGTTAPAAAPSTSPIAATGQPTVTKIARQPTTGRRRFPPKPRAPRWTGHVKAG